MITTSVRAFKMSILFFRVSGSDMKTVKKNIIVDFKLAHGKLQNLVVIKTII